MTLQDWLLEHGKTQQWLANQIGCSQPRITQIIKRGTNSAGIAFAIQQATKGRVKVEDLLLKGATNDMA